MMTSHGTVTAPDPKASALAATLGHPARLAIGILLTAIAGYVDAIGYIELGGFFASFMSGASISLGVELSEARWDAVQHAAVLIGAFVVAATVSSLFSGLMRLWALPFVLFLEATCLCGALAMTAAGFSSGAAIVPVIAAMGVQNTALHPVAGVRLGVTYMTGTLVSLSQALGRALIRRGRPWDWVPHAAVWCFFVAGAVAGASAYVRFGFAAIILPATLVAASCLAAAIALLVRGRSRSNAMD